MSTTATLPHSSSSSSSLLDHLQQRWREFTTKLRFKYLLPRTRIIRTHGFKLDVSTLPSLMKNNILEQRYEVQELAMAAQHLSSQDRVLELGGAIGFISLYCQTQLRIQHYTSVEANPHTRQLSLRNHQLNHITPHILHAAAAAENGSMELDISQDFWSNSITQQKSTHTITVPTHSLSSILKQLDYQPTVLIADIEGAEQYLDFSALPPATQKIIIELHPSIYGEETQTTVHHRIESAGYRHQHTDAGTSYYART